MGTACGQEHREPAQNSRPRQRSGPNQTLSDVQDTKIQALEKKLQDVATGLRDEMQDVQKTQKTDIRELERKLQGEMVSMRKELQTSFQDTRQQALAAQSSELLTAITSLQSGPKDKKQKTRSYKGDDAAMDDL